MDERVNDAIQGNLQRLDRDNNNRLSALELRSYINCAAASDSKQVVMSKQILAQILANAYNDPNLHLPGQAPNLSAADVVGVINQSGITVDTVYAAQVCRKQGPGIS